MKIPREGEVTFQWIVYVDRKENTLYICLICLMNFLGNPFSKRVVLLMMNGLTNVNFDAQAFRRILL